jgi:hypothetical protein
MDWQPIETAPKDGRRFLAVDKDGEMGVVWWNRKAGMLQDVQCIIDDDGAVTHWMPLPKPPSNAGVTGLAPGKDEQNG